MKDRYPIYQLTLPIHSILPVETLPQEPVQDPPLFRLSLSRAFQCDRGTRDGYVDQFAPDLLPEPQCRHLRRTAGAYCGKGGGSDLPDNLVGSSVRAATGLGRLHVYGGQSHPGGLRIPISARP